MAVQPTTRLSAVKADLVKYLQENARHLEVSVPDSPEEVELGAAKDPEDLSHGFDLVEDKGTVTEHFGKKDWTVVAWRIQGEKFDVEIPIDDEEEEEDEA